MSTTMLDLDSLIPGSNHFRWREFLWLPKWGCYVFPNPTQHSNLIKLCDRLDFVRERLGVPMRITSGLRPTRYNEWKDPYGISGAIASAHTEGKACDFQPLGGMTIAEAQSLIEPMLEYWNIRMEKDTADWIHLDIRNVLPGGSRYFLP